MKLNPGSILLICLSVAGAFMLTSGSATQPYENELLEVAVHQSYGDLAPQVMEEPPEIQALLLDYVDDEPLRLQARLALIRYPDLAHRILPVYGNEPLFQEVLLEYGEAILPPIAYFMDHDLTSLEMRRTLDEWLDQIQLVYGQPGTQDEAVSAPQTEPESGTRLTPEERGWYAIHFLVEEGHDLLGQFTVRPDGTVEWVQTERVLEGLTDFFFGGIRGLEIKWHEEKEIEGADWGWAALDVAVIAGSVKLLRAFQTVKAARPAAAAAGASGFSGRVAVFGSRVLARGGRLGASIARLGAIPAAVYLMIRYPSLVNATLAEFANWLGVEPGLVQFLFWLVALWIILTLAISLLRPLSLALRGLSRLTGILAVFFGTTRTRGRHHQPAT
jgi:hypothetical protein